MKKVFSMGQISRSVLNTMIMVSELRENVKVKQQKMLVIKEEMSRPNTTMVTDLIIFQEKSRNQGPKTQLMLRVYYNFHYKTLNHRTKNKLETTV